MIKYTKEKINEAVLASYCVTDVCRYFNLSTVGNMHTYIKNLIKKYEIDISHFDSKIAIKRSSNTNLKLPLQILSNDRFNGRRDNSARIRKAMIEYGFKYECEQCNIKDMYNNKPITLEVDHIDGNCVNNEPSNVRFLCPNCHSQTDTYKIKNSKKKAKKSKNRTQKSQKISCLNCSKLINRQYKRCVSCNGKSRSKIPDKKELEDLIWKIPSKQIALQYNVSDSAVVKWCKKYQISKPSRGYWAKLNSNKKGNV